MGSIRLPEGVEIDVLVYLRSDTLDAEAKVRLGGLPVLPAFDGDPDPLAMTGDATARTFKPSATGEGR